MRGGTSQQTKTGVSRATSLLVALLLAATSCSGRALTVGQPDASPDAPGQDIAGPDLQANDLQPQHDASPPDQAASPDAFQPPPATWAATLGGGPTVSAAALAVDKGRNVWVTGSFLSKATLGGKLLMTQGSYDLFIARFTAQGKLSLLLTGGSPGYDAGIDIATDSAGNAYLAAEFNGTIYLGGGSLSSVGSSDIMVAKITPAGQVSWLSRAGGAGLDRPRGIAVLPGGGGFLTGTITGGASFGLQNVGGSGLEELFVARFSASSAYTWARAATSSAWSRGIAVAPSTKGSVILAGEYGDKLGLGGKTAQGAGNGDLFTARLSSSGTVEWLSSAGGPKEDQLFAAVGDGAGGMLLAGRFTQQATFGAKQLKPPVTNPNVKATYFTRVGAGGSYTSAIMTDGFYYSPGVAMGANPKGGASAVGYANGPVKLGSVTLCNAGLGNSCYFVVNLTSAGQPSAATSLKPAWQPLDVALDLDRSRYVLGNYDAATTIGGTTLKVFGTDNVLVWKMPGT